MQTSSISPVLKTSVFVCYVSLVELISQTVFMLSIAINRAERVCATVIIKHNYMLMCNHKSVKNIMLCLLNSTGHSIVINAEAKDHQNCTATHRTVKPNK